MNRVNWSGKIWCGQAGEWWVLAVSTSLPASGIFLSLYSQLHVDTSWQIKYLSIFILVQLVLSLHLIEKLAHTTLDSCLILSVKISGVELCVMNVLLQQLWQHCLTLTCIFGTFFAVNLYALPNIFLNRIEVALNFITSTLYPNKFPFEVIRSMFW